MPDLTNSNEDTRRHLASLVSRIAERAVSEYRKPFERGPLMRALPHLAIANPRLGERQEVGGLRLWDTELSLGLLVRMGGEVRTPTAIRTLMNGLQGGYYTAREGASDGRILDTLADAGIDIAGIDIAEMGATALRNDKSILDALARAGADIYDRGTAALREAVEKGSWFTAQGILDALADACVAPGVNIVDVGIAALQAAVKAGEWFEVNYILGALTRAGADIADVGPAALWTFVEANHSVLDWPKAANILDTLARASVDISDVGPAVLRAAVENAVETGRWYRINDMLDSLALADVAPGVNISDVGAAALRTAMEGDGDLGLAALILHTLSCAGVDFAQTGIAAQGIAALRFAVGTGVVARVSASHRLEIGLEIGWEEIVWDLCSEILAALAHAGMTPSRAGVSSGVDLFTLNPTALVSALNVFNGERIADLFDALFGTSMDIADLGRAALRGVVEAGLWKIVPSILDALAEAGIDIAEPGTAALCAELKGDVESDKQYTAKRILDALARAGVERVWIDLLPGGYRGRTLGQIQELLDAKCYEILAVPELSEADEGHRAWLKALSDEQVAALRGGEAQ